MSQTFARKLLLMKQEVTEGVDAGPGAATDAILTSRLTLTPVQGDRIERDLDGASVGNDLVQLANKTMRLTFDVEISPTNVDAANQGVAAPGAGTMLEVCGMQKTATAFADRANGLTAAAAAAEGDTTVTISDASTVKVGDRMTAGAGANARKYAVTAKAGNVVTVAPPLSRAIANASSVTFRGGSVAYKPRSSGFPSATLWLYSGNNLFKFFACRGSWGINFPGSGYPRYTVQMQGKVAQPINVADANFPTGTFNAFPDPLLSSRDNTPVATLDGYAIRLRELTYDHNLELVSVDVPNFAGTRIPDRAPSASIAFEEPLLTDHDFYATAAAAGGSKRVLQVLQGPYPGPQVRIDMPAAQLMQDFQEVDYNGVKGLRVNLNPIATSAGDDEIAITYVS